MNPYPTSAIFASRTSATFEPLGFEGIMTQSGYYQQPTICKDKVVFVCDDSLWTVSSKGGTARRLTNPSAECHSPRLSPDGKSIAFISGDEGDPEVYIMPSDGGSPRRLTYLGSPACSVLNWTADGKKIIIASDAKAPFFRHNELYELSLDGQTMTALELGHATAYSRESKGRAVLGRNSIDPALWKRYRGGRAGEIWVDNDGKGNFRPLLKLEGNMVAPMWIKGRVYFLSDHEGIGNIYSCKPDGRDLKKHTHHSEYYVRYPSTDGERIIYSCAGDLHILDCESDSDTQIKISASSQESRSARKFADAFRYLDHFAMHPAGHSFGFVSRGQAFSMPLFDGPCIQHSPGSDIRQRLFEWHPDGSQFLLVDDSAGYERIARHSTDIGKKPEYISSDDIGRVTSLKISPNGKHAAFANHRFELRIIDLDKKKIHLVDTSPAERILHLSWSPDSRWLAYSFATHSNMRIIKVADANNYKTHEVTRAVKADYHPCWDPAGKYLYFLSDREYRPIYDSQQFDLSFHESTRPFFIPLSKETPSIFAPELKPFVKSDNHKNAAESKTSEERKKAASKKESDKVVQIDFEGITDRSIAFPIEEGSYSHLCAAKGRILFLSFTRRGIGRDYDWEDDAQQAGKLLAYDFAERKTYSLLGGLYSIRLNSDNQTLMCWTRDRLRVFDANASSAKEQEAGQKPGRSSGIIDMTRCNLLIEPRKEWAQMYREAWRLQREHFWDEKMSAVDWDLVFERYNRVLPKIRTRSELSDLIWEMQGELGTSHAYEWGGDRPRAQPYYKGFLGCDLVYDSKSDGYKIGNILRGDSWDREADSPLAEAGAGIEDGDIIIAVNGKRVSKELSVDELLMKLGGKHIQLTLKRGSKTRSVNVQTLDSERYLRYRAWVENNRQIVNSATKGRAGYVHIPDMGPFGYAEFHRSFLSEFHHDALIIDARYNRGGHVSSLLLEKLMRKRVGYDVPRWGQPQPYPMESPSGPMVAVTNQFAGSDGDIFSHCFKLYELGPLVGKRTWGGVIGISPRHGLVDGSLTTQPEYSFWFQDVGWSVENYGTDPDYEVDFRPQDYHAERDPQLDKAIDLVLDALKKNPVKLPSFKSRPKLPLPAVQKKSPGK